VQYLILSDLHANWHALEAVLADAKGQFEQVICCGDLVGYYPDPVAVLEWTRARCRAVIRGNHDKIVAGLENLDWFNEIAQIAARWTMAQLTIEQLHYLQNLPMGPLTLDGFQIWHGSPRDEDEYVATAHEAEPCFRYFELPLGFFGHTHLQGGFFSRYGRIGVIPAVRRAHRKRVIELEPETVYMINPGSVGQPRDGDPRAAYAIYDSEEKTVTLHRVEYPIQKTADAIVEAGLPDMLGLRLFHGL
jgi:predicted phosphodiesterase